MDVSELAQMAVTCKKEKGLLEHSLKSYERFAKRLVQRYERIASDRQYDKDMLTRTVCEFHEDMGRGCCSKSTFKKIRRIAADIEDLADYGTVGEDLLPAWGKQRNPMNRPISDSVKNDPNSVIGLAFTTLDLMAVDGYSSYTIQAYHYKYFPKLIWYFEDLGVTEYSDDVLNSYLDELPKLKGNLHEADYACMRTAVFHVKSVHETGKLYKRVCNGFAAKALRGPFAFLITEFENWSRSEGNLEASTIEKRIECIAQFLEVLRENGVTDLSLLSHDDVRAARKIIIAGKSPVTISDFLNRLRAFAKFVSYTHPEIPNFIDWLGRAPKVRRKMPIEGYSREQAEEIVASVDASTTIGKRDRAVLMLAKNTGLRGVDIRKLTLSDIDWRANKITIVQSKTKRTLTLPLDRETGEALATYILEARRKDGDDTVFLTVKGKAGPLTRGRLRKIVEKYARPVVGEGFTGRHGVHAFRRGLGKTMVEAGVPLEDVADVLGHGDIRSTGPYVAVSFERLRICAAGLEAAPAENIWWLK